MGLTALIILMILLVGGLLFIRRMKNRDNSMNRYRDYQARSEKKAPKIRRNRYHRTTVRHEPDMDEDLDEKLEVLVERVKEPELKKAAVIAEELSSPHPDDPDIVLGLKETEENRERPIPNEAQITLKPPPPPPPPVITFYVMAEEGRPFNGYELLQAILSVGARFGQHQIFHRHVERTGSGPVLFSIASAEKPGNFDLTEMGGFSTAGLSLFFCASDVDDPIEVYELMLQTSGQLIEDLGGNVLDEGHQLLTPTTVVNQRRALREYMQGQQVPDLFEIPAETN